MLLLSERVFVVIDVFACTFHELRRGSVLANASSSFHETGFGVSYLTLREGLANRPTPMPFSSSVFSRILAVRISLPLLGHPLTGISRSKVAKEFGGGNTRTLRPGDETGRHHRHPQVKH